MQVETLEIENFLAIGKLTARLDNRGLVAIQGKNEDDTSQNSNGAGKSSFPDALCWAGYGITARGDKGDSVVNRTIGKNTRVAFTVIDNADAWRITRYRKHAVGKNRLTVEQHDGATWVDRTLGTDKLTQELVERILGCSYEVFSAAIYFGQENMPDLPGMTDKFLKVLIEEAAGISRIEACYEEARKRMTVAEKASTAIEASLSRAQADRERAESDIEDLKVGTENWKTDRAARHRTVLTELANAAKECKALIAERDAINVSEIKAKIAECQKAIDSVAGEKETQARLAAQAQHSAKIAGLAQTDLAVKGAAYKRAQAGHDSAQGKLGAPCGECGRVHDETTVGHAIEAAHASLRVATASAQIAKTARDKALALAESDAHALAEYERTMTDISAVSAALVGYERQLGAYEAKAKAVEASRVKTQSLKTLADRTAAETCPSEPLMTAAQERLKKAHEEHDRLLVEAEAASKALEVAKCVVSVFGPAGVRAHILDSVTPLLNDRTAHYLSVLSDGNITAQWSTLEVSKAGELKEKFHIEVSSATGAADFRGLSGGEKRKVRLATSMALQDLVSSRATKPFELYIADEIDHAIDTAGLERLMQLLDEKARDKGTVLVISHNDLADWIRDSVVMVKKDGQSSMAGGALV